MPTKHKPSPQREFVPWLTVARVVLSKTTNTESAYPEVSSSPPLESRLNLIRQGTIKVLRHPSITFQQPIMNRPLIRLEAGEPRHCVSPARNHHIGPACGQIDQLGELGPGLVDVHCLHKSPSTRLGQD